jgi:hypothetical protein
VSEVAAGLAGVILLVIGLLHLAWVRTAWPCASRAELARNVVGRPQGDLPPIFGLLSLLVGGLLVAAGLLVTAAADLVTADLVPVVVPDHLVRLGAQAIAAVLAVRGAAGLVQSGLGLGDAPERYRQFDLRVYSPLCLVLAALILIGTAGA